MTIVYLIFLMLAGYCSFKYDGIEEPDAHKTHRYWALCLMLICISGFSYGLGGDKFVYMENFDQMPEHIDSLGEYLYFNVLLHSYMPFWSLLNVMAKSWFDSFYVVQLVQSAFVNIIFCYVVSKYTRRQFMFLIVYFLSGVFFQFNTEVMREGLAVAFGLLAIEAWMDKNKWRYLLLVLVGLMFHVSAVLVLVFPFCHFVKIKRRTLPVAFGAAFTMWVMSDFLASHAASFAVGGIGMLVQKVITYSFAASTLFGFLRSAITFIILPFIVMYYNLKWTEDEELRARKEKLMVFCLALSVLACAFAGFSRLRSYSEIYNWMFFADFVFTWLWTKERFIVRTVAIVGIVFLTSLKYFVYYPINKAHFYDFFIPYTCILDEDRSIFYRHGMHTEATEGEVSDNNTRKME